jgi:WD40 repeat protein
MNNNLFVSMSQDNELYANRITGLPVSAEGPLTDANDMVTKYYSLQNLGDQMFACLMADRMVEIWRRGSLWTTFPTEHVTTMTVLPNRNLLAVAVHPDGRLLLSEWTLADIRLSNGDRRPSQSTTVAVAVAAAAEPIRRTPFLVAALGDDHVVLVCEESSNELLVITLGSGTILHTCIMEYPICSLAFYDDRDQLFAGNKAGLLLIWSRDELLQRVREPVWTLFSVSKAPLTALKPLHDNALACGDHYGRLHVMDLH